MCSWEVLLTVAGDWNCKAGTSDAGKNRIWESSHYPFWLHVFVWQENQITALKLELSLWKITKYCFDS